MLPEKFKERMRDLLGDEAENLFREIENGAAVRSFRLNPIKVLDEEHALTSAQIDYKKAVFPPECYYTEEQFPGSLACHHAGAIYMQDPSAMATIHAIKGEKGIRILDSCSAPGGKTTQLAAIAGDEGIVVANEYDTKRCRILQGNVERLGCRNTVVTNLDTSVLAETYPRAFDVVLCDAPCSGEGMFRKNELAISEWSEEKVLSCAEMQREILGNVSKCVAKGGSLIYSTCTFSLEENEMNVDWFLRTHPDFELCEVTVELKNATVSGICNTSFCADMSLTRRIYPHKFEGEGQFIALFRYNGAGDAPIIADKKRRRGENKSIKMVREEADALREAKAFLEENLVSLPDKKMIYLNGRVYLSPDVVLPEYSVFSSGVCVGELERGRFVPHHQLFSAYGDLFVRRLMLSSAEERTSAYLRGLEIDAGDVACSENAKSTGYAVVTVDGVALGGGKISNGVCKNHYPKGLRNQK